MMTLDLTHNEYLVLTLKGFFGAYVNKLGVLFWLAYGYTSREKEGKNGYQEKSWHTDTCMCGPTLSVRVRWLPQHGTACNVAPTALNAALSTRVVRRALLNRISVSSATASAR